MLYGAMKIYIFQFIICVSPPPFIITQLGNLPRAAGPGTNILSDCTIHIPSLGPFHVKIGWGWFKIIPP
jgi:hypothetical protein